jgi:hypothetical protein
MVAIDEQSQISEHDAIDAFHSFLKNSLAQARAEKLLDDDTLSSAEADLMISGTLIIVSKFHALPTKTHLLQAPPYVSSLPRFVQRRTHHPYRCHALQSHRHH